jgi:ribonucleoside-diphosphate reductase beta chain
MSPRSSWRARSRSPWTCSPSAWGTFTCRRHVAADDSLWDAVDERMQELLVPAMGVVTHTFEEFEGEEPPFVVDLNELAEYAMDKIGRRLRAIESARGADLRSVDVDVTPEQLEERFHAEDLASQPFTVA